MASLPWLSSGDADEVVVLRGDDFHGDDVAGVRPMLIAGDEDEAIDVRRVGGAAAKPDVLLAFDRLIEDDVERAANLRCIAGESDLLLDLHQTLAALLHDFGGHVVGQLRGWSIGLEGIGKNTHAFELISFDEIDELG